MRATAWECGCSCLPFLLCCFGFAWGHFNFDRFVEELLVLLACAGQQERIRNRSLPLVDASNDVGAADPVGLVKIRLRPLLRTGVVRVVDVDDVESQAACLTLDFDQFLGRDVVAIVGAVGARIARAYDLPNVISVGRCVAQHSAAALVRVGLLAVRAQGCVVGVAQLQHQPSCQKRSLRYLSAESDRMVTMTASRPALASCSAIWSEVATAPAADTPTNKPSLRPSSRATS